MDLEKYYLMPTPFSKMNNPLKIAAWAIAVGICQNTAFGAEGINVDINKGVSTNFSGTAAAPDTGIFWNSFTSPATNTITLVDVKNSAGTATVVDITFTRMNGGNFSSWNDAIATNGNPNPVALMQDYIYGSPYQITISSLTPGAYALYAFAHGNVANQVSTVTLGTANGGASGTTGSSGTEWRNIHATNAPGYSYLLLIGIVGPDGVLSFTSSAYLNGFQLIEMPRPTITVQPPATLSAYTGTSIILPAAASSIGQISWQWQKSTDGGNTFANIAPGLNASASTNTFTINDLRLPDTGAYRLVASNLAGQVMSTATFLTVEVNPTPIFDLQPFSQKVLAGNSVVFHTSVSAPSDVSYQWFKDGVAITGATGPTLTIGFASESDSGSYQVQAANLHGSTVSSTAALSVVRKLPLPAFPGAEGPGSDASGGRGGDVYHVTTLLDDSRTDGYGNTLSPPGSLRHALNTAPASGRTIVFDVAGTIRLTSSVAADASSTRWLRSGASNITIAGQTAPYPGITIVNQTTKLSGNNIILRNLAFRPGPDPKNPGVASNDGLSLQTKNSIIDHVSCGFMDDEGLSPTDAAMNTTVQYSIIAEGLNYMLADGTRHAFGTLLSSEVADAPLSLHHNLYSDMSTRNPRIGNDGNGVVLGGPNEGSINSICNNVVYNWSGRASYDAGSTRPARANFLNNCFIAGPSTGSADTVYFGSGTNVRIYHSGNVVDMNKNAVFDVVPFNFTGAQFSGSIAEMAEAFAIESGYLQPASEAYTTVLNYAGTFWWNRTPIEARIIDEVRSNSGGIIKSAAEVATISGYAYPATSGGPTFTEPGTNGATVAIFDGLPFFPQGERPAGFDTDSDGMPNSWEIARGLNPELPDNNGDYDQDGYTNLEEYINEVAAFPAPKALSFNPSGGRYALCSNWDLNWQPSHLDTVIVKSGTVIVDAVDQHAGILTVGGAEGLPVELQLSGGWLDVAHSVTVGGSVGPGKLMISDGELRCGIEGLTVGVGGTLAGAGTLHGSALINGTHAPGTSGQYISGQLSYGPTACLTWHLYNNATASRCFGSVTTDTVGVNAGAVIDIVLDQQGSTVDFSDKFWTQDREWPVATANSASGAFGLGRVSVDSRGRAASPYGTFYTVTTPVGIKIKWSSKYQAWSDSKFGADAGNNSISAPEADPDGDSASNTDEFWAGTHPLDARDRFHVYDFNATSSQCNLKVMGRVGRIYTLERTPDLLNGLWTEIARTSQLPGDSELHLADPLPLVSRGFYRVRVLAP